MASNAQLTVFFDGACPLCRREIAFYQKRRGADAIEWRDVSVETAREVAPGLSACDAMARFHVRDASGALYAGGDAFARLWRALPAFRVFGEIARIPPIGWVLNRLYDGFLKIRPHLQASARRHAETRA
ncbi:MAG: thiol-disulfide oxidoreductase DCC family protein [Hyphococcus sp.]